MKSWSIFTELAGQCHEVARIASNSELNPIPKTSKSTIFTGTQNFSPLELQNWRHHQSCANMSGYHVLWHSEQTCKSATLKLEIWMPFLLSWQWPGLWHFLPKEACVRNRLLNEAGSAAAQEWWTMVWPHSWTTNLAKSWPSHRWCWLSLVLSCGSLRLTADLAAFEFCVSGSAQAHSWLNGESLKARFLLQRAALTGNEAASAIHGLNHGLHSKEGDTKGSINLHDYCRGCSAWNGHCANVLRTCQAKESSQHTTVEGSSFSEQMTAFMYPMEWPHLNCRNKKDRRIFLFSSR